MDKTMQTFFDTSLGRAPFTKEASIGEKVYYDLVLHRFREVITQSFPIFCATVPKELLQKAIGEFVKNAPSTPYIWQVPQKFWEFVRDRNLIDLPYMDDLCWYEWIEVELMMEHFEPLHVSTFLWQKAWKLDESVRLRELRFRVFESEFTREGQWFLLAWYDRENAITCYKEIGEVLYLLLKSLNQKSLHTSLKQLAKEADVDEETLKEYLAEALRALANLGVIAPKEKR